MIITVADHADTITLLESVVQKPLERAPSRMDLDGALDAPIMRVFHVGIAPADMRDDAFSFMTMFSGSILETNES